MLFQRRADWRPKRYVESALGAQPIFEVPLQTSIVPSIGQIGGSTPTASRASGAYVMDHESVLRLAIANEMRMWGARRVRNLAPTSETVNHAQWVLAGTATKSLPLTINFPANNDAVDCQAVYSSTNRVFAFRFTASGNGTLRIGLSNGVDNVVIWGTITLTATPTEFTGTFAQQNGTVNLYAALSFRRDNGAGTTATQITFQRVAFYDVTGQSVQTPDEYVSTGVLSAPYQGANVDGVQYFDTVRLHTQNMITYSSTLNNAAWVASEATVLGPFPASDGTLTAWKIVDSVNNTQHGLLQLGAAGMTVLAGQPHKYSVDVKRGDYRYATMQSYDQFGNGNGIRFDFTLGVISTVYSYGTAYGATGSFVDLGGGWFRLTVVGYYVTTTLVGAQPILTNDTPATTYVGSGLGTYYARIQVSGGSPSFTSSYVATTSAAIGPTDTGSTAAIPPTTLLGYAYDPAGTQLVATTAAIRNINDASWTKTSMTAAQTSTGVDGVPNSASRCTASAINATAFQPALVAAATSRFLSVYLRRITGTGNIDITMNNGAAWATVMTGAGTGTWVRVMMQASILNPQIGIRIAANGDAVDVDFVQLEADVNQPCATSAMGTTGASRAGDLLAYPSTGNIVATVGTAYSEQGVREINNISSFPYVGDLMCTPFELTTGRNGSGQNLSADGTSVVTSGGGTAWLAGVLKKLVTTWGGGSRSLAITGGTPSNGVAFDGDFNVGVSIQVGVAGSTTGTPCGVMRNVRIFGQKVSDAQKDTMVV